MKQVLVCKSCEAFLTNPVTINQNSMSSGTFVNLEWENAVSLEKAIIVSDISTEYLNSKKLDEFQDTHFWLNTQDVSSNAYLDVKLSIGCCGPGGGINTRCICKSLIGSTYADCIGPHYFSPDINKTKWIKYIEDNALREEDRLNRLYRNAKFQKQQSKRHKK